MKDAAPDVKRDAVENVRAVAGEDIQLHGFGFGLTYINDQRVADNPLLDSLDCTTPIQAARHGDYYVYQTDGIVKKSFDRYSGAYVALNQALASGLTLISFCRAFMAVDGHVPTGVDAPDRDAAQLTLTDAFATPDGGERL